ncbi:hypothetical protein IIA15_11155 [candidate division TA06 bacterium]|nr:hypothetical protein [candidate division TA06 bacterium]
MNPIPILSNVVLVATGVTIVLAVSSYAVYRLRDLRKRKKDREKKKEQKGGPKYFERFYPEKSSISEE